jgi:hypothetical protein
MANGIIRKDSPFQGHNVVFRRKGGTSRNDDLFQGPNMFYLQHRNFNIEKWEKDDMLQDPCRWEIRHEKSAQVEEYSLWRKKLTCPWRKPSFPQGSEYENSKACSGRICNMSTKDRFFMSRS